MAAPHQNIADVVVLKTPAADPDFGDLNLDSDAPVGLKLAALRKAKGLTHADVNAGTKIKIVHIAAIESGDRAALPATPFTAGFVKAYAQFLGLDADAYARAYKQEAGFTPLAAPLRDAIIAAQKSSEAAVLTPAAPAAPATQAEITVTALTTTAIVPVPSSAPVSEPTAPAHRGAVRSGDADKVVTWLGAGAAIAVVAFLAGRAVQPQHVTSDIPAPAPTFIAEAPAPVPPPVAVETAPLPVDPAPPAIENVEPAPVVAAVRPPVVKPQPRKKILSEAAPAPVEATPPPVIVEASSSEAMVTSAQEEPAPAPEPKIIAARMTRSASPDYPERCAMRAGEKVSVNLVFSITAEGRPVAASVVSSDDRCFNAAAQRAVYDMRFSPRTVDGVPTIETGKTVTVQFVR
jgi:TonB family protein